MSLPSGFLTFQDSEYEVQDILKKIETRLATREINGLPAIPTFQERPLLNDQLPTDIHHHLQQVVLLMEEMDTEPILAPSPATRVPILGWLWGLIREQAHGLPLFYVNRHAGISHRIHSHLLSALNGLAQAYHTQQKTITQLEAEIKQLREQQGKQG